MNIRLGTYLFSALLTVNLCGEAPADVSINISEATAGTRFQVSGSVTIFSGGASNILNGFWLDARLSGVRYMTGVNSTNTHPVISGSGTIATTLDGVSTVTNTQVFPGTALSIITSPGRTYEIGNEFTLLGDFITSQPFSNFIPGTYSDNVIGLSFNGGLYQTTGNINLSITAVPEPSSLLFSGFVSIGVFIYVYGARRKLQSAQLPYVEFRS